jgi:hypothetical protein
MQNVDDAEAALSAPDLRSFFAFTKVKIYRIAGRLNIHPSTLSCYLHGHRALAPDTVERILEAIQLEVEALAEHSRRLSGEGDGRGSDEGGSDESQSNH